MQWPALLESLARRYEHLRVLGADHARMVLRFGTTRVGVHIEPAPQDQAIVISAEVGPVGVVDATEALALNQELVTSALAIRGEALVVRAAVPLDATEAQFDARLQSTARVAAHLKPGVVAPTASAGLFSYLSD